MRLRKSTRYALCAVLDIAAAELAGAGIAGAGIAGAGIAGAGQRPVSAGSISSRYDIPETVLKKVLQDLQKEGLVTGSRGASGGYRLARPASQITVLDVIGVFEPARSDALTGVEATLVSSALASSALASSAADTPLRRLRQLLAEVDEVSRCTFASVTLATLIGAERAVEVAR